MALDLGARVAAANSLIYEATAFAQGMTSDDFRANLRDYGERVRWFQAVESEGSGEVGSAVPDREGRVWVERVLGEEMRVFLYQNTRDVAVEEFGLLGRGSTMISFLPDEIEPLRDDRFLAIERTLPSRQTLLPSGEESESLNHRHLESMSAVWQSGKPIEVSRYRVAAGRLIWNGSPPEGEVTVAYRYVPFYEWQGKASHQAARGSDGKRLPGSGPLRLLSAGEE